MRFFWILLVLLLLQVAHGAEQDVRVSLQVEKPRVGTTSELLLSVTDPSGRAVSVLASLEISLPEDDVTLFSGSFYLPDGRLRMSYHFQDASEHAVNLRIYSPEGELLAERTFLVEVALPEPPTGVWLKTWAFLMGVMLLGIAAGALAVMLRAGSA